eukprot:CAMPEP_0204475822 /NCGR_PEP_ID=MMETSP0471-20130131/28550_1 /ASSEMBLY_ACC=CAM_ASM_000602 /TAXON_ID=2969 /ORGANISM="Oxyrrhis marina" /LENGTH=41 /DNA_ID= /DNA_START= /DNA_END= /DNA_ORIENTATION=
MPESHGLLLEDSVDPCPWNGSAAANSSSVDCASLVAAAGLP